MAASWATRLGAQPQQMLVGMAMVARGEFAYMVAETAQGAPYLAGEPGQRMMRDEVYASVVWALVMATIVSPLLFRWALGIYGRATPILRSRTIGGIDPALLEAATPPGTPKLGPQGSRKKSKKGSRDGVTAPAEAPAAALPDEFLRHQGKGFRIRIASRHHIGVQRGAPSSTEPEALPVRA